MKYLLAPFLCIAALYTLAATDALAQSIENREGAFAYHMTQADLVAATVVYQAARGRSYLAQAVVAEVIRNRYMLSTSAPDLSAAAFEVGLEIPDWPPMGSPAERDPRAWRMALEVVGQVYVGDYRVEPERCARATHVWLTDSPPRWSMGMSIACRVDDLTFGVAYKTRPVLTN